MDRRAFLGTFIGGLGLLGAPLDAAPTSGRVVRIGILSTAIPRSAASWQAFERRLQELGYIEGRTLTVEFRTGEGNADRLRELAAELVTLHPDVIVTSGTPAAMAAKAATPAIPIVMANVGDPLVSGLVASLARPGGNLTGLSLLNVELSAKGLQVLKDALPRLSRVGVLWNSRHPLHPATLKEAAAAASRLRVKLEPLDVRGPEAIPDVLATALQNKPGALLLLPDPLTLAHGKTVIDFAATNRMPVLYPFREMVEDGGLMSYGSSLADNARRAAAYVDRILKGARPHDLPIEQATVFEFVINLKTAKALGLTIPPSVLARADEVIQ
jgi:putative ABC transport system substrate-binding protein